MQFPDHDRMTEEQRTKNEAVRSQLIPGKYYRFEPPIRATGVPTGGLNVCELSILKFKRGFYLGFRNGVHVFQGRPIDDLRPIDDRLRECYFHVLFIGGTKASVDPDQSHQGGRNEG